MPKAIGIVSGGLFWLPGVLGIRESMVSKTDPKRAKNPEKGVLAGIQALACKC
jgi:hypothetical protein